MLIYGAGDEAQPAKPLGALLVEWLPKGRPVKGIVFDKTPAANWKVPWHQDLTICVERRIDVNGFGGGLSWRE